MTIEATWFGGPWDGKVISFPHGTHDVNVALTLEVRNWMIELDKPMVVPSIRYINCPIRLTSRGYLIIWKEPT